ncbi:MAG TPA: hypothetical protein VNN55_03070 [bacterium]|nr:hypothetical protein [bacterium]
MGATDIRVVWEAMQKEHILTKMLGTPAQPHVTLAEFRDLVNQPGTVVRSLNGPDHEPDVLILLQDVLLGHSAIAHIGARRRAWGAPVRDFARFVADELFDPFGAFRLKGLVAYPCWALGQRFAEQMGFVVHPTGAWFLTADRFRERRDRWVAAPA